MGWQFGRKRKQGLALSFVGSEPPFYYCTWEWSGLQEVAHTKLPHVIIPMGSFFWDIWLQNGLLPLSRLCLSLENLIKVKGFISENKGRAKVHDKAVPLQHTFLRSHLEILENILAILTASFYPCLWNRDLLSFWKSRFGEWWKDQYKSRRLLRHIAEDNQLLCIWFSLSNQTSGSQSLLHIRFIWEL